MKFSEFLKERETVRSEKFKESMRSLKNKRILFYKLISVTLKDSNCWKDAIKVRNGFNIGGIRLTIERDMSDAILETGYNRDSPSYNIRSIIDPQRIIRVDISLPTTHDPYMRLVFEFDSSVHMAALNDTDLDDMIASTAKFFDVGIEKLLEDPVVSDDFDGDEPEPEPETIDQGKK
jgi:hypothetical protein